MKKFFLSIVALGMIISLSGCGETKNDSSKNVTTINFWHHYSAQSKENEVLTKIIIPKFEEENPNIKVNSVSHEWSDLHDKILVSSSSDTLPDVARLDLAWIPEFESSGILTPLNKEFEDFDSISEGILDNAMEATKIGDNNYGLGLNINTKILFYNKDIFEAKQLKVPETMEEFEQTVKILSGKNKKGQQVWGYNEPALSGWNVLPIIWSFGGDILNEDQTMATGYINGEKSKAAIRMLKNMYSNNELTGWNSGDIPTTDGLASNRYMMAFDGPWKITELKEGYPDYNYGTATVPSGEGGSHSVIGGEAISLFKNNDHQDEAWKFAKFMTSEFAQKEMAKVGQIPVNKQVLNSSVVAESTFAPFLETLKNAKSRPTVSCWTEIDNMLSVTLMDIMNDKIPLEEGLDKLAKDIDKLLAEED
ncbi:extracellular solute-binding protein (plasmid) [Enterococcus avium]|mgnify:CR=1 FL=1|uniref:extracellular solute-binding protein n=1 Tax=Enterococcus TaxID=1350 RepID=UPI000F4F4AA2|nr:MULTISPECIES: extracellular solute-binding protein [Enterococcus]ROY84885.1 extracellular solute-binding protein [Enterococcus gallinarum]